jgi:ABC-type polysaccharide/polyol phosphate export permease
MFQAKVKRNKARNVLGMLELIYHSIVRDIRKSHRNAFMGLALNILQSVIFILTFYVMINIIGGGASQSPGDFLLYIMSGIFLYLTHTKAMGAVVSSEGPASAMMQHAPMNTAISICAAALSSLYLQLLSMFVILLVYHVGFTPVVIDKPIGAMGMVLLSWASGVAVGMIFLGIKPFAPEFVRIVSSIYGRANMIASGKMFLANSLPAFMLVMFSWNPLFHCIDQARGYIFLDYNPHFSSVSYPVYVTLGLLMIGLMGEFYARKNASLSWSADR